MLLAVCEPEVFGPVLLIFRVSLIMAVPAGRSVVFVTGNAKKLEEVKPKHFLTETDSMLKCCPVLVCFRRSTYLLIFFMLFD